MRASQTGCPVQRDRNNQVGFQRFKEFPVPIEQQIGQTTPQVSTMVLLEIQDEFLQRSLIFPQRDGLRKPEFLASTISTASAGIQVRTHRRTAPLTDPGKGRHDLFNLCSATHAGTHGFHSTQRTAGRINKVPAGLQPARRDLLQLFNPRIFHDFAKSSLGSV